MLTHSLPNKRWPLSRTAAALALCINTHSTAAEIDRTVLPIHVPEAPIYTELDARNVTPPAPFKVEAPQEAPNVVVILLDDMGFGVSSSFGGPAKMPTADMLAKTGLRYNQFHTTALSSPTRTALLTGRNHHMNNMGSITETATAMPGYTGQRPDNIANIASVLRYNGYSTAHFGKNHETAPWEISLSGPTDRWPTRQGFDKFYGFFGGETNQWAPMVYDGMTSVELPDDPNYHFMTDMTDKAISWVNSQQSLTPEKPFFLYFAPGATHAPHHVPKDWIAKYKGKFDQGWDKLREETLARQIKMGIVPKGTQLAPKPADMKDWNTLSDVEKKLFARQMETFAAFAEYTDVEIGRLIKSLEDQGELDNTIVFYVLGDNGSSAEGGPNGSFNENVFLNQVPESIDDQLKKLDNWGDPSTYPHMAYGWAIAGDTPFSWAKQIASDFGGTRNGLVVHWPKGIDKGVNGEVRTQFTHVIDVVPTILEASKLPEPSSVNGVKQTPIQGKSILPTFKNSKIAMRNVQYFEIGGNRAIYSEGWFARIVHRAPWESVPTIKMQEENWELYNVNNDFSLTNNIAKKYPEKVKELNDLFMKEASANHVLPIDDRGVERLNAALVGRPDLMGNRTSLTLFNGMRDLSENVFINVKNRSKTITADITIPEKANGVILAQGGRFGGWSLYLNDGKPTYTYNFLGMTQTTIASTQALPKGKANVRFEFAYDGGGFGKGGNATLFVNGKKESSGRIEHTQPLIFSLDETADVGIDGATSVIEYKTHKGHFDGIVDKVIVDVGEPVDPVKR